MKGKREDDLRKYILSRLRGLFGYGCQTGRASEISASTRPVGDDVKVQARWDVLRYLMYEQVEEVAIADGSVQVRCKNYNLDESFCDGKNAKKTTHKNIIKYDIIHLPPNSLNCFAL